MPRNRIAKGLELSRPRGFPSWLDPSAGSQDHGLRTQESLPVLVCCKDMEGTPNSGQAFCYSGKRALCGRLRANPLPFVVHTSMTKAGFNACIQRLACNGD